MSRIFLSVFIVLINIMPAVAVRAESDSPAPSAKLGPEGSLSFSEMSSLEAQEAINLFVEHINEARRNLTLQQRNLAANNVEVALNLLSIIEEIPVTKRRLTRVEFGGGIYADDLNPRKIYAPIETHSLENFSLDSGPRWVKRSRAENDAIIIYISLELAEDNAPTYLNRALTAIKTGENAAATVILQEMTDEIIKVNHEVPPVQWASDYITLAGNYLAAGNFFGARLSLERAMEYVQVSSQSAVYEKYRMDIETLGKEISDLIAALAAMDAEEISKAEGHFKRWKEQLSVWIDS